MTWLELSYLMSHRKNFASQFVTKNKWQFQLHKGFEVPKSHFVIYVVQTHSLGRNQYLIRSDDWLSNFK